MIILSPDVHDALPINNNLKEKTFVEISTSIDNHIRVTPKCFEGTQKTIEVDIILATLGSS